MSIYRNTDGFSALPASHPLANLDIGNPFKWSTFFDDFNAYDKTQLIGGNPYVFTVTNACVDTIVGPTGVLTLTLGGADNDAGGIYLTEAPFQMTSGKRAFFQARFKLTLASGGTVAANEMFIGLSSLQAPFDSGGTALAADDMLGFYKFDTGAAMSVTMREGDSGSTDGTVLTPTDGGWFTVAIYYDGAAAHFYASPAGGDAGGSNMALKASLTGVDVTSVVSPHVFIKAGEAKANIMSLDYWLTSIER